MDISKTYLLFEILRESRGYPNFQNITIEVQNQLRVINDSLAQSAQAPKAVPSQFEEAVSEPVNDGEVERRDL